MNIIREYSLDQVRKNRRTSISIMVAVLIASTFLCALLVFAQSFWNQMVQQEIYIGGDWDAELMDVPADRLGMVRDNAGVKAMFVKGDNQTAFLPEGTALPRLLIQNCDIWTMNDEDGELRLTIMATLAQNESKKTSMRVKAGQMVSFQNGVVYGTGNVLGYDKVGPEYVINEEQAETVRRIFDLYLAGNGYGDVEPATEADVSGKLENLQRLMGQFSMPEDGEFSEEQMDKYVSGVRVYEDRFEWLLNLSPDAGGGLDDAGSPVYFKKITVTPDDERAWFRKHPQWSKSNRYAELEVWIFI
ncbi:hypothetical protein [Roseburia sp. 1XD42-69]|uniref:hypothetical protein n=1 Tax=Roseburia sp. 1XD42-69 TaxID=2320088 RepID=UPI0026BF8E6F